MSESDQTLVMSALEALCYHAPVEIIDDAAIKAGILWRCVCGWVNPAGEPACTAGDGCPGVRQD